MTRTGRWRERLAAIAVALSLGAEAADRVEALEVKPTLPDSGLQGAKAAEGEKKDESGIDWKSTYGFAVGIGFTPLRTANIESASIRNGTVRIDKENNGAAGVWLEFHQWAQLNKDGTRGWGPFVAIQAASSTGSEAIGAFALGLMYGSKGGPTTKKTVSQPYAIKDENNNTKAITSAPVSETQSGRNGTGFNIGIAVASVKVQTLGDGLTANQPPPTGVTEIYYKTKRMYVPLIMTSFTFDL